MLRKTFYVLSILLVLVLAFSAVAPASANQGNGNGNGKPKVQEEYSDGVYIVQMIDDPVVAYDGSISGFQATKPDKGQKINPKDAKVVKYVNRLINSHNDALAKAGGGEKFYDYTYSFNGFAAKLTGAQASKLAALPNVVSVSPDEVLHIDTSITPSFLGLNTPGGAWDQVGGVANAGEDVVVGIVDSGLWPENPSFSDQTDLVYRTGKSGKRLLAYGPPPSDWYGTCQSGEQWSQDNCNNKVIGARYYLAGFGHYGIVQDDYKSARDHDGHGSHTSSTAAGNYNVTPTGDAAVFGNISGMAPRARIAVYKVCWNGDDGGCTNSDSVAAIDQAVADGVDVINFSISGTTTAFLSPVEVAFLFAADAGVFVAASAGNEGPGESTVAHPSPWLTTVAASTHRSAAGDATLGDASVYTGVTSSLVGVGPAPLVFAGDVGDHLCAPGSLNPALVTGKIVACDRGVYARVDKSFAVKQAGGVGMILMNVTPNSLNADLHYVPTVHVQDTFRAAILAYISGAGAGATAELSASYLGAPVPAIAEFSSRGPSLASEDQIKPDITAPGVDVLAAVAPPGNHGRMFDLYSGTSMSSPHIAGLGALMKDAHPDWTPAMIKSAMMTSAYDLVSGADPFAQGAGHVQPNSMIDPGLVYDNGFWDWYGFLCGTGQLADPVYCPLVGIDPSDLNLASIAIGGLAGSQSITRTVTNVGEDTETYDFAFTGLTGVDVVADPSSFTLNPGESQTFTVTFTVTSAALNTYATGFIFWNGDQGHVVRSPVAVKPVALAAPGEVSGTGDPINYDVAFGYTGNFQTEVRGLIPAATEDGFVVDDPANDINVALASGVGITMHTINIPAGTTYARFSLFDDFTDGEDDLDMYVFDSSFNFVGSSGGGTAAEEVNVVDPADTTYYVIVHGWQTDGPDANYTLFSWALGSSDEGNMTVSAPASAVLGGSGTINLTFSGLSPATKYLGSIAYSDGVTPLPVAPTIVRIDTP